MITLGPKIHPWTTTPNPVTSSTTQLTVDGEQWFIRSYKDGKYDAVQANGPGISPGFDSYQEAARWVRLTDEARSRH